MPFKSKRQMRWMFANKPKMAKRWAKKTPDIKSLPETVKESYVHKLDRIFGIGRKGG